MLLLIFSNDGKDRKHGIAQSFWIHSRKLDDYGITLPIIKVSVSSMYCVSS